MRNKSRLLITSGGKQRTPDGRDHSPFTKAILKGLRTSYVREDGLFLWSDLLAQLERVSPVPHEGTLQGHEEGGFVFIAQAIDEDPKVLKDRDGNVYGFEPMKDGKVWMTKNLNLNLNIKGSYCYDDKPANCDTYGRLYTWEAAKEGCKMLGLVGVCRRMRSGELWPKNMVVQRGE